MDHENDIVGPMANTDDAKKSPLTANDPRSLDQSQKKAGKGSIERYQNWIHGLRGNGQQTVKKAPVSGDRISEIEKSLIATDTVIEDQLSAKDSRNLNQSQKTAGRNSKETYKDWVHGLSGKRRQYTRKIADSSRGIPELETSPTTADSVSSSQLALKDPGSLGQPQKTAGVDSVEIDQDLIQELGEKPQQPFGEVTLSSEGVPRIELSPITTDNGSKGQLAVNDPGSLDQPQYTSGIDLEEIGQDLIQEVHEKPQQPSEEVTISGEGTPELETSSITADNISNSQLAVKDLGSLDQSQTTAGADSVKRDQGLVQELDERPQQLSEKITACGGVIPSIEKSPIMKGEIAGASSGINRHQQPGMNIIVKDERPRGTQSGDIPPLDLKRHLNLIRKRRVLFASVAAAIITVAFIISHIIPPLYEARTLVSIEKNFLNDISKGIAVSPAVESKVSALSTILNSRTLIYKVLSDLDLEVNKKSDAEIEKLIKSIQDRMEVKIEFNKISRNDVDFFAVSFKDQSPKIARDYVNTLIGRYIEESLKYKREESTGANSFLLDQINLFKEKVGKLDQEIVLLRDKEEQAELMRKKEEEAELMKNNRIIAGDERLVELKKLQGRLDYLVVHYTDTFPEVVKVKEDIEALKAKIKANPYKPPIDGSVRQSTGTTKVTPSTATDVKTRLAELERERDTNKRIYDELASAYGISQVSTQAEIQDRAGRFRIVDPAILPYKPVSPDRVKIMLIGIFAGLAGAFGLIMGLDSANKSVKSVDSLKKFGLPVIVVPHMPNPSEQKKARRNSIFFYGFSGLFVLLLVAVLMREVLDKLQ